MNFESALLSKAIEDGDLQTLLQSGISPDYFYDLEMRELFTALTDHYSKYTELPSAEYLAEMFPALELDKADDSIPALIERVQEKRVYNELANLLEKASKTITLDPLEAMRLVQAKISSIATLIGREEDIDITKCTQEVRAEYMRMKNKKGNIGIPWPWKLLNDATLGMHKGNLIFIYGRPKSMKTWVMMYIAWWVNTQCKHPIVFASQEMGVPDIRRRAAALFCGIPYQEFRGGKLTTKEERNMLDDLDAWSEGYPYVVTRLQGRGEAAVAEFGAKLRDHKAKVGFFDGVYLAGDEWEDLVAITRGLKRLAQDLKIPIIGTCQENRQGQTAYSDSFLQDCDALINTKRTRQEESENEVILTTPAMREARLNGFAINAIPCTNFTEKYTVENDNVKAEEQFTD